MKIAIMMRAIDQDTGFRVYVDRLVDTMINIDKENEYLLLYRTDKWFGKMSHYENVKEVLIPSPHKLLWDQVMVPYKAWREKADVIFNPKFSVPLVSHCPVSMGLQEPAWWAWPEHHPWWDVKYMRLSLPLYCRKSAHIFPMSQFILDENRKYLGLPFEHATVTYTAQNSHFRRIDDTEALEEFRKEYGLPEKFILSVTRVENIGWNTSTTFCGTKNVETTIRSYNMIRDRIPHKLVIAGKNVREYLLHVGFTESDLEGVTFLGFVPHDDIPKLYNLGDIFIMPSYYEGCPHVLIEAMTCGSSIVASHAGPIPEVSDGAVLLADPYKPEDFAEKLVRVAEDPALKEELRAKSLERAKYFNWERSARATIDGLTEAVLRTRGKKKDQKNKVAA